MQESLGYLRLLFAVTCAGYARAGNAATKFLEISPQIKTPSTISREGDLKHCRFSDFAPLDALDSEFLAGEVVSELLDAGVGVPAIVY